MTGVQTCALPICEVFSFPQEGRLANTLNTLVDKGNDALLNAEITIDGEQYEVEGLQFTEQTMTIVLR